MMNYSMQGMTKTIPELFVMLKLTKVEIKREHQVLMIDKTTSFKKRAKGKKGKLQVEWQTSCHSHEYLVDKKDGKVNKGIFDIQVIDVCLTSVYSSP